MFCWGNEKQNSFNRIRKGQHFVYFIGRFTKAFVILPPTNQLQLVLHEGYHATIILQFDCSVIGYFILMNLYGKRVGFLIVNGYAKINTTQ